MENLLNDILKNQLSMNTTIIKIQEGQEEMRKDIKNLQEGQEEMRKDIKNLQEGQKEADKKINNLQQDLNSFKEETRKNFAKVEFKMNDGFYTIQELLRADENGVRGFEKISF